MTNFALAKWRAKMILCLVTTFVAPMTCSATQESTNGTEEVSTSKYDYSTFGNPR